MAGSIYTDKTAAAGHSQSNSSWDWLSDNLGEAWDWVSSPDKGLGAALGVGGAGIMGLMGMFDENKPDPTGYQGKIPNYQFNRQPIQQNYDPNRRPGSGGRRYFTDGTYSGGGPDEGMPSPVINQQGGIANATPQNPNGPAPEAPPPQQFAKGGGIESVANSRYLRGESDGMADKIPTKIDNKDPAALSHGEFVIPADVVSHLGNGNSEAGAKVLEEMMERVRKERTGNPEQGKRINPEQIIPR